MSLARLPKSGIWLLLMAATGLSWWFSSEEGANAGAFQTAIASGILIIAFIKVRLIMMHFMEIETAPAFLRWLCEFWMTGVCTLLICLYRLPST